jgi:hypothetical protein
VFEMMNIPKIPMYMYCHLNRQKKHGGSTYIYRNDELGLNRWSDKSGSKFYVMPVSEVDGYTDEDMKIPIPALPETHFDTLESLFAAHPELLQKANELYGESK